MCCSRSRCGVEAELLRPPSGCTISMRPARRAAPRRWARPGSRPGIPAAGASALPRLLLALRAAACAMRSATSPQSPPRGSGAASTSLRSAGQQRARARSRSTGQMNSSRPPNWPAARPSGAWLSAPTSRSHRHRRRPACRPSSEREPVSARRQPHGWAGQAVAGAAHGLDHARRRRQRLAQALDVHVDRALLDEDVVAPHLVEQLRAAVHALGVLHQVVQQLELGRARPSAALPCQVTRCVAASSASSPIATLLAGRLRRAAAQHGADARQQLLRSRTAW